MERLQVIREFVFLADQVGTRLQELQKLPELTAIELRVLTDCHIAVLGTRGMVTSWDVGE